MCRVLVTGGTGFVGRHLVAHLHSIPNMAVTTVGRRPSESDVSLVTYAGDLTDATFASAVVADATPDIVFHLAAQPSVADSWRNPAGTVVNNLLAQLNLLEAVSDLAPNARFLIAGSAEEYGRVRPEDLPLMETAELRPESPYAASKVAQDYLGLQYFLGRHLDVVRLRTFNLIGPGQSDRFAVASFARQIAEAEAGLSAPVVDVGNLAAERDFTDARDAVRAYWLLAERGISGEVYNVGGGGVRSIGDILAALISLATRPIEVRVDPGRFRPNDTPVMAPNLDRLRYATGWEPRISFDRTLIDILDFWRQSIRHNELS